MPRAALDEFSPPHAAYKALKAKLAELRGKTAGDEHEIADGPLLKLDAKRPDGGCARAAAARAARRGRRRVRPQYDAKLADAVKKFQKANELNPDGMIGTARTHLKALNGPTAATADRHHPRQHGALALVSARSRQAPCRWSTSRTSRSGDARRRAGLDTPASWSASRDTPTPLLTETMKYITVNPTWNVPPSIVHNEYLPALQQDPTVLARMGLKVEQQPRRQRAHLPAAGRGAMRSAASASTSRTASWSISTTRRTSTCSRTTRAPTATAACGCRTRRNTPRCCCHIARPNDGYTAAAHQADVRHRRAGHPAAGADPGPSHLSDRVRGRRRQAASSRRDVYGLDSQHAARSRASAAWSSRRRSARTKVATHAASSARVAKEQPGSRTVGFFEALFGGGGSAAPVAARRRVRRADRRGPCVNGAASA